MNQLVLDANVALDWFFPSPEGDSYSLPLRELVNAGDTTFIVPEHFMYEVSRLLVIRAFRGKSPAGAKWLDAAMQELDAMPSKTLVAGLQFRHLGQLSLAFGLSAPDVPYFHIARNLEVPIATRDKEIIKACAAWHVTHWQPAPRKPVI